MIELNLIILCLIIILVLYVILYNETKIDVIILSYNRPQNLKISLPKLLEYNIINNIYVLHGNDKQFDDSFKHRNVYHIDDFKNNEKYYTIRRFLFHKTIDNVLILDDDIVPTNKLLNNMLTKYMMDKNNIYGPYGRKCDKNGYDYKYKNMVLTGMILTNKNVIKTVSNKILNSPHLDFVVNNKGNGEDLLFNYHYITTYKKTPVFVNGDIIELDDSNGYHQEEGHIEKRSNFCKVLFSV